MHRRRARTAGWARPIKLGARRQQVERTA
jgi:hypothetical protein